MDKSKEIVNKMFASDWFSQWLGIEIIEANAGSCKLKMKVRKEMLNGFGIAHGGITYSLADSALAFASNSHGKKSVSIETSISHTETVREGDFLFANAIEKKASNKIGIYEITVLNQENIIVGLFKGTVYRTSKDWEL